MDVKAVFKHAEWCNTVQVQLNRPTSSKTTECNCGVAQQLILVQEMSKTNDRLRAQNAELSEKIAKLEKGEE